MCLADVFDALITKRCYKEAYPAGRVIETVREERGRAFDPRLTEVFFNVLDDVLAVYKLPQHCADGG